jgi:hypothetical protein
MKLNKTNFRFLINALYLEKKQFHLLDSWFLFILMFLFSTAYLVIGYMMYCSGYQYIFDLTSFVLIILITLYTRPNIFFKNLKLVLHFPFFQRLKKKIYSLFNFKTYSYTQILSSFLFFKDKIYVTFAFLYAQCIWTFFERPFFYAFSLIYCSLYWTGYIKPIFGPLEGF